MRRGRDQVEHRLDVHTERYPHGMEKLRLGGMALANGVLVHGPTAWGAAVRTPDGAIASASGVQAALRAGQCRRRSSAGRSGSPRRSRCCPTSGEACPRRASRSSGRAVAAAVVVGCARGRRRPRARASASLAREAVAAFASLAPAGVALRGGELASYHGAEHVSIGTYETRRAGDEGARPVRRAPRRPAAC